MSSNISRPCPWNDTIPLKFLSGEIQGWLKNSPSVPANTWNRAPFLQCLWEGKSLTSTGPVNNPRWPNHINPPPPPHLFFVIFHFPDFAQVPTPSLHPYVDQSWVWFSTEVLFPHCSSYWRKAVLKLPSTNVQLYFSLMHTAQNLKELKYGCLETCSWPQKHVIAIVSELSMVEWLLATVQTAGDLQYILVKEFEIMFCSSQLFLA